MTKKKVSKIVKVKLTNSSVVEPGGIIKDKTSTAVILASLQKQAKSPIHKLKRVTEVNKGNLVTVGTQLKILKTVDKEATKQEKAITDVIQKSLNMVKDLFKPFHDKVKEMDTTYKLMIANFVESQKALVAKVEKEMESGKIKKVSTYTDKVGALTISFRGTGIKQQTRCKAEVIDETKVPRKYLVPNMKMIDEDLKAGISVPGCELKEVEGIAI